MSEITPPTEESTEESKPGSAKTAPSGLAGWKVFANGPLASQPLRVGAVWAVLPALAFLGLSLLGIGRTPPSPLGVAPGAARIAPNLGSTEPAGWVVAASETVVVRGQANKDATLLRGRLEPSPSTTVLATTGGEVSKIVAKMGAMVSAGRPLIMISTGNTVTRQAAVPTGDLRRRRRAEAAQTAAVRKTQQWNTRVGDTSEKYQEAMQRVAASKERVAAALALVQRLRDGQTVKRSDAATKAVSTPSRSTSAKSSAKTKAARAQVARDNKKAQHRAEVAEEKAKSVARTLSAAESLLKNNRTKLQAAQSELTSAKSSLKSAQANAKGDDKSATDSSESSDVERALSRVKTAGRALSQASEGVSESSTRTANARRDAVAAGQVAKDLRAAVNRSSNQSSSSLEDLHVFADEESTPSLHAVKETSNSDTSDDTITIAQAAKQAREAIAQSQSTIADAERIRKASSGLSRPISQARQQLENANSRLNNVEQQMWSGGATTASKPNLQPVYATATGVVLWVADVATNLKPGDPIGGIGRPDRLMVTLLDTSGAWKSLEVDNHILAVVQNQDSKKVDSTQASTGGGMPTLARVMLIVPPMEEGKPAKIRVAIHNPPYRDPKTGNAGAGRMFAPGTPVACSLDSKERGNEIAVPAGAIRHTDQGDFVAVFKPVVDQTGELPKDLCNIDWRPVEVGQTDGINVRIKTGLKPGDRVSLRPQEIFQWTSSHGPKATLLVEQ